MSDAFDRIGPPREHPRPGREALFSTAGVRRPGLACARCDAITPVSVDTVVTAGRPPVWVLPWRRHYLGATCPACRRRSWLRIAWG